MIVDESLVQAPTRRSDRRAAGAMAQRMARADCQVIGGTLSHPLAAGVMKPVCRANMLPEIIALSGVGECYRHLAT